MSQDLQHVVMCVVFSGTGKDRRFLLVLRNPADKQWHSGKWCVPGGKVEDESVLKAAQRELFEETGFNVDTKGMVCLSPLFNKEHAIRLYPVLIRMEMVLAVPKLEATMVGAGWFTVDEINSLPSGSVLLNSNCGELCEGFDEMMDGMKTSSISERVAT